jgi:hypothetical protein
MSIKGIRLSAKSLRGLAPLGVTLMVIAMVGGPAMIAGAAPQDVTPQTPLVQQFEDVPDSHTFAQYINALYLDNVISGYPCGSPGEPCVPPANMPYYRPNAGVTRGQMSKFVDLGRRNIADATGDRLVLTNTLTSALVISTTANDAITARTSSGQEAVDAQCTRAGVACYAVWGSGYAGNRSGRFSGGIGVWVTSAEPSISLLDVAASGATAYGGEFNSSDYVSLLVGAPATSNGYIRLRVDGVGPALVAERILNGALDVQGNLIVSGSKSGYVVDAMQNADTTQLAAGDVVVVVGSSAPVLGEIPVPMVRKANSAYDTGVMGIVDQVLYVPDAATKAAYEQEQKALDAARDERARLAAEAEARGEKFNPASFEMPQSTITDEQGIVHALADVKAVAPGGYINVVTLGAYKAVKVDASYGAIQAGDLLTTSPNPGYAMKVTDKAEASGAIIGKALGNLDSGTGTVPVMVTLK